MNPVSGPIPGGRRRIDLVLADGFTAGLTELPLDALRERRREAEQEEVDLSYTRRMLQGRLDILRAEAAARAGEGEGSIVDRLAEILGDRTRAEGGAHGLGRHFTVEPSRVDEHRRAVEQAIADVGLSDVSTQTDDQLRAAIARLAAMEHAVSELRRRVQAVLDALTAEVGHRYADGRADVSDVLPTT
jgi:hypothetical protein